jgi:G3E family GTPase
MERIPFTVIGGFLGAGKTTLLNRWLSQSEGLRLAVLVNDFGAINIDATLVAQMGANTVALTNGCVCCSIGDDLSQALMRVLDAQPAFDAVVVEASGVSDPWRIAQYGLADPRLSLNGVIVLIDTDALAEHLADPLLTGTLTQPLAHADLVVLNKADLASAEALAEAKAWVQTKAPTTNLLPTVQAELPLLCLGHSLYQPHGGMAPLAAKHDERFESWHHAPQQTFDEGTLRGWVKHLPAGVLRLKALLPTPDGRWLIVQWAGRHGTVQTLRHPDHAAAGIIAIGLTGQLPTAALAAGLAACTAVARPEPTTID